MGAYGPSSVEPNKNVLLPVEAWDADVAYTELSVVFHAGSLWVAAEDNENSTPASGNADWSLAVGGVTSGMTSGSVLFSGSAGAIAQDNANLFWDNADDILYVNRPQHTEITGWEDYVSLILASDASSTKGIGSSGLAFIGIDGGGNQNIFFALQGTSLVAPSRPTAPQDIGTLTFLTWSGTAYDGGTEMIASIVADVGGTAYSTQWKWGAIDASGATYYPLILYPSRVAAFGGTDTTTPGLKGGAAGATLAVRTANDAADAPLSASTLTLSTRSGTDAKVAAFTSAGTLCEVTGASGTFTTVDLKTVTVTRGIITSIST